jgi:hypothetical protein
VEAESVGVLSFTVSLYLHEMLPVLPVSTKTSYEKVVVTASETLLDEYPGISGMHVTGCPWFVPPHSPGSVSMTVSRVHCVCCPWYEST